MSLKLAMLAFVGAVSAKGVDVEQGSITFALSQEPPNLDSSLSEDTTSARLLRFVNEGLVKIDRRGEIQPGVAMSWTLAPMRATFVLRRDAYWSDGKPVTAHDFVYAWRRLVDPKTAASGSTFYVYVFENGTEILKGEKPPSALGVRAIDDYTLEVTLSHPVPYLLNVLSNTGYMPLRQDFVEAQDGRFAADAKNLLSNGPFKLDSWVHSSSMSLTRNPYYWDQESVSLDRINVGYITADTRSLLNLYKSGELALLRLDENVLGDSVEAGYRIKKAPTNCMAWLVLNLREDRPTSNLKLRKAIRAAFNRDSYVNSIVGLPGVTKIDSIFSGRIRGVKGTFQSEYPAPEIAFDLTRAKALLEEAKIEMGVDVIPPIVLLANETRQIDAEFVQSQLKTSLGLDVRVDKQTFKQAIAKMHGGDFDMARAAFCGGSILDPVFFAGIFKSDGSYNDGEFDSSEYDRLMNITHGTADQQTRMDAFAGMQQILFDEVPIIPTHIYSWIYLQDDRLRGLVRYPVDDFSRGYIDN